jgi:hypothetical protein
VASTPASTSFAWDDFGIGMAAAFGLVLLTGGLAVAVRIRALEHVSGALTVHTGASKSYR